MQCPQCTLENSPGARFCNHCGTALSTVCPHCGHANTPGSRFCGQCGRPLTETPAGTPAGRFDSPQAYTPGHLAERILTSRESVEGERKQVTVLFADLRGSMELLADRDPEEARALLDPVLERMIEAVHRYEGMVNQVMGDGVMALFGAPIAHEDHALRACYAALLMQEEVRKYAVEVQRRHAVPVYVRVGVNSGEVVVRSIGSDLHLDYTAVGQTTHLAARMEQTAMPGSILITPQTLRLVEGLVETRSLGPVQVKGLSEPIEVFELTGAGVVRSRFRAAVARGLTRFVGRQPEIEHLRRAQDHARAGRGQVVAIVGEPGVGKSRLFWEFVPSRPPTGWLVLETGAVSYGRTTPYLLASDLLKAYCRITSQDGPREMREKLVGKVLTLDRALEPALPALFDLLGLQPDDELWRSLDGRERRRRRLEAVKGLLLREARVQPVVLIFEDLHWIDTESQAVLDTLVESLPAARLLLLVNYRPEYQHGWGSKTYYTQLRLDPLPPESAGELLRALLGDDPSLQPVKGRLIDLAEGNPFFLEESVRTLVETKLLAGQPGAYRLTAPVGAIEVPPTVQAILAARIDRLPPDVKRLLQTASVIGKDVPLTILQAVAEMPEPEVRRALGLLAAGEFLYETRLFPDQEYTFKHALTHEVAYGGLLKERRREAHRRVGEALEKTHPDRIEELAAMLAHHFLESGDLAKGLRYSVRAAERAEAVFAHDEALRHYERAREAATALGRPEEVSAIDEGVGNVYYRRGLLERAVEAYARARERTRSPERRAKLKLLTGQSWGFGDPRGLPLIQEALQELNPQTQREELAQATALLGRYHHYAGQHEKAIALVEQARALAAGAGRPGTWMTIFAFLAGANQHLARFAESMDWARRCLELGERTRFQPALIIGHEFLAENLEFTGSWDESLRHSASGENVAERIGAQDRLAWAHSNRAAALYGKGDLRAALPELDAALALGERTGEARLRMWVHSRRCILYTDLGMDDEARADGLAGITLADELRDLVLRAYSRFALGYHHLQRESWPEAGALFAQMSDLLADSDNRLVRLAGGPFVAEAALGAGQFDDAAALAGFTLDLAREAEARHIMAVARRVQGQILAATERWTDARAAFDQAATALEALGSRLEWGRALYHRGRLRRRHGETAAAERDDAAAFRVLQEIGAQRDAARAHRLL